MQTLSHLSLEEIQLKPGQEWSDSTAAWRFLRVGKGPAEWSGTVQRSLLEGEVLIIAPHTNGIIRADSINGAVLNGFSFTPCLMGGFFTLAEHHFFETAAMNVLGDIRFLPAGYPLAQRFTSALERCASAARGLAPRVELLRFVAELLDEPLARSQPALSPSPFALYRFRELMTQMSDMEFIGHTPEELAGFCRCTLRHFNRAFHACFSSSPRAWRTKLRLNKAAQVLCTSDERIAQIATECGFHSLTLFNSSFKKQFGITPSQWREQWQQPLSVAPGSS
jgi:AraC-like DNA-binding protein